MRLGRSALASVLFVTLTACGMTDRGPRGGAALKGDWNYYRMLGGASIGGFGGMRHFGFAHFEGPDTTGAFINRRGGTRMERFRGITLTGDSVVFDLGNNTIRAVITNDTIAGKYFNREGIATHRVWFIRRNSAPEYEPNYALWPGTVSDSQFSFTIDPAVPMKARDGIVLMNFVATPDGPGPFGVVMERTPYLR